MQDAFDILNKHIQSIAVKSTLISGIIGTSSFPRIVPSGFLWDWNPEYVISGYQEYVIEQYKGFPNHPHYFKIYSSLSKYLIFKANEEVINKIEINTLWTDKYIFYEYQGLKVKHPYPVLTSQSLNINCQLSLANIEKITSIEIQNKENIAPLPPNKSSKFETGVIIVQAIVVVILTYVLFY